jgi:hypothetical protein
MLIDSISRAAVLAVAFFEAPEMLNVSIREDASG